MRHSSYIRMNHAESRLIHSIVINCLVFKQLNISIYDKIKKCRES